MVLLRLSVPFVFANRVVILMRSLQMLKNSISNATLVRFNSDSYFIQDPSDYFFGKLLL